MANVSTNQAVVKTRGLKNHLLRLSNEDEWKTFCGLHHSRDWSLVRGYRPGEPFEFFANICESCVRSAHARGLATREKTP